MSQDRVYRYHAFGVPELGLQRGLGRDLVVAPYATALALTTRPAVAVRNLKVLEQLGVIGRYGFYAAIDFTPERVPTGKISEEHTSELQSLLRTSCAVVCLNTQTSLNHAYPLRHHSAH